IGSLKRMSSSSHWSRKSWTIDPLWNAISGGGVVMAMMVVMMMTHFVLINKNLNTLTIVVRGNWYRLVRIQMGEVILLKMIRH
ncbi:hypothetical protein, partial [Klebsiella pneumoniae]|uniref:hypothetical protein n=1 Tax=Klebsiella pneumoniae TaxID=573 RepID=UPI00301383D3